MEAVTIKRKPDRLLITSSLVCLLPLALSAVFYHQLPDMVATHWSSDGIPNGFSSRFVAAFVLPLALLALNIILHVTLENDPKKRNMSAALKTIVKWAVPVLAVLVHTLTIVNAVAGPVNIGVYTGLLVGLVFIICGNYLPKCKQNYTMGIRLPWTLHSEDNWNRTHRFAGFLWVACGLVFMANVFMRIYWLYLAVIAVMAVCPVVYSFILYRRSLKPPEEL